MNIPCNTPAIQKWIQTQIPTATFITSTNEIILPRDAVLLTQIPPTSLQPSQILKLIHDMIYFFNSVVTNVSTANTNIQPDNIIHIPSANNLFIIHPSVFEATAVTPTPTHPIHAQIAQIIDTLWQPSSNTTINAKVTNFITTAKTKHKFVWTSNMGRPAGPHH